MYVFYFTYNMMHLPPLESLSTLVDEYSNFPREKDLACARCLLSLLS